MNEEMGMTEVKKIADWKSLVKYSPEGPQHHVLADTGSYRAVLVGIQAGGTIPQHPSTDATYHFLEGTGTMIVDDERFLVSAGTTMVVPAKAARGIEAETQLAFLGSHGGHGNHADQPFWGAMVVMAIMLTTGKQQASSTRMRPQRVADQC
jgi:mannose-6-phosphate isomerase-like protein (cupin superfamily)